MSTCTYQTFRPDSSSVAWTFPLHPYAGSPSQACAILPPAGWLTLHFPQYGSSILSYICAHSFPQHRLDVIKFAGQTDRTPTMKKLLVVLNNISRPYSKTWSEFNITSKAIILVIHKEKKKKSHCFSGLNSKCLKVVLSEADPGWTFQLIYKQVYEQLNWKVTSELLGAPSKTCNAFLSLCLFPFLRAS